MYPSQRKKRGSNQKVILYPLSVDLRGISIVWRAASWGVACCRRQLSALQTMEMPLDGDKYDWLLNLQTLGKTFSCVSCSANYVFLENLLSIGNWYMPYLRNRVSLVIVSLMMAKNYGLHSTAAVEIFSGFEPLMMIKRRARWLRNTRWFFFRIWEHQLFVP